MSSWIVEAFTNTATAAAARRMVRMVLFELCGSMAQQWTCELSCPPRSPHRFGLEGGSVLRADPTARPIVSTILGARSRWRAHLQHDKSQVPGVYRGGTLDSCWCVTYAVIGWTFVCHTKLSVRFRSDRVGCSPDATVSLLGQWEPAGCLCWYSTPSMEPSMEPSSFQDQPPPTP